MRDATTHRRDVRDRRVSRTRSMLLASFDRLILARGYDDVSVRDIAAGADVGRSTFYEHFEGKDDMLGQSVARPLAVLAAAAATSEPSESLEEILIHVHANRALVNALLQGSTRAIVVSALASKVEGHLATIARRSGNDPSHRWSSSRRRSRKHS